MGARISPIPACSVTFFCFTSPKAGSISDFNFTKEMYLWLSHSLSQVNSDPVCTFYVPQMFQYTESERNLARNSGLIHVGLEIFFFIFPICIFSDFVISKLAFLIHYFSVSVSELGWIVLQPSSPFRQNHSACSLNSTHFLRVWIYFQIEKNKHSRDTIQEIQELGGWALYPWTGEERQGLGVSGCQEMPDL